MKEENTQPIFDPNKLYKIVYKDELTKSPKAFILYSTNNYLVIKFPDNGEIKYINHNVIITISEVLQ